MLLSSSACTIGLLCSQMVVVAGPGETPCSTSSQGSAASKHDATTTHYMWSPSHPQGMLFPMTARKGVPSHPQAVPKSSYVASRLFWHLRQKRIFQMPLSVHICGKHNSPALVPTQLRGPRLFECRDPNNAQKHLTSHCTNPGPWEGLVCITGRIKQENPQRLCIGGVLETEGPCYLFDGSVFYRWKNNLLGIWNKVNCCCVDQEGLYPL